MSQKQIYGLIGYPVKHSLSAAMHNAAFRELGINAEYRLFEVKPEKLKDFLQENIRVPDTKGEYFNSWDIVGFNITIPHKVRALELGLLIENVTTRQDLKVLVAGAINTVKRDSGRWQYTNTDIVGFMRSLHEDLKFNSEGKNIFLFGCGGTGRAVIAGLTQEGAGIKKIYVYDTSQAAADSASRHFSKFKDVINKLEFVSREEIPQKIKDSQLLINASPIGMKEADASIIDKNWLHPGLSVYDVVYNRETQLIKDATSRGLNAVGGQGMLLYQGVAAFEFWFPGQKEQVEVMRKALTEAMENA